MKMRVKVDGLGKGAVWSTEATRELLGFLQARIIERTRAGISASGQRFQPYKTEGYGDTVRPDLHDTGTTLGSIAPTKITMTKGRLVMLNREAYSVIQNRMHPYMGVLQAEAEAALDFVERKFGKALPKLPTKMASKMRVRVGTKFVAKAGAVSERQTIRKERKRQAKLARRREYDRARREAKRGGNG